MYLVLNGDKKIIVNTANELEQLDLDKNEIYICVPVNYSELINDSSIRDEITSILKDNQLTNNEVVNKVSIRLDIPKNRVQKVVRKMKKEKLIYNVDDFNYLGERLLGMN